MIYKIILSSGDPIPIEESELIAMFEQMKGGSHNIITGEGAFNPSFYVQVVPDYERTKEQRDLELMQSYKLIKEGDKMIQVGVSDEKREKYLKAPLRKLLSKKMDMKQLN